MDTTVLMFVPEIEGSSTLKGYDPEIGENKDHTGWIPVESCTFGFSREDTVSDKTDEDESEVSGPVTQVNPITVKRSSDYATAPLLMWLANKDKDERKKDQVLIDYVVPSGRYYLRYELAGVELVSCSLSYTDPDQAEETLVFTFDEVRILQRPIDSRGEVDVGAETVAEYQVFQSE